jgi:hypothetical protein
MDEKLLIRMVLRMIADGPGTLEWLLIELEPHAPAMEVSRAFQSARELRWVAAEPDQGRVGDPRYQLTDAGLSELQRGPTRSVAVAGGANRESRRLRNVSLQSVLGVFADFEPFGGASIQLVAWELDVDQDSIAAAWTQAIGDRLLEPSGIPDFRESEKMWKLTERGRQAHETSEEEEEELSG